MYIQEVIIEGFKSYAQRTVIQGWDPQFNAITGLNGSGKSNILDAICFVLGISNLSQVRAGNLQDLVYKQGQAGITKASVTIVFNNSDPKKSPIGYEHHDTISVCRQIVLGGRNKYMINGHTVQGSTVVNFFHSVLLNVNNPHFLIMQGRITKVLNMKPPEILGLIEEAAGTRMYETNKIKVQKTMEKKAEKVTEITKILNEEITPKLEKLRADKTEYVKWTANNATCEQLSRLCIAYDFTCAEELRVNGTNKISSIETKLDQTIKMIQELKTIIQQKNQEIDVQASRIAASKGPEYQRLMETESSIGTELVKVTSVFQSKTNAVKDAEKARNVLNKTEKDLDQQITTLTNTLNKQRNDSNEASQLSTKYMNDVTACQAKLMKVTAGMSTEEDNTTGSTLADTLMKTKASSTTFQAQISQSEMKMKHLTARTKDLTNAVKEAEKDAKNLQTNMDKANKTLETKKAALQALNFDAKTEETARATKESTTTAVAALQEAYDNEATTLQALIEVPYERNGLGSSWNENKVKGTVANLIKVKRSDAATALEVAAGAKLYQIVVDTDETSKTLLSNGCFKKRVTILPLNKIQEHTLTKEQLSAAETVSKGGAVPAITLIGYPEEVGRAIRHVFGDTFICNNPDIAKAVCFDPKIHATCVTLVGDVFDPRGTLEGGSSSSNNKEPLLLRLDRLHEIQQRLSDAKTKLQQAESTLSAMAKASKEYAKLSGEVELAEHEVALMKQRFASSSLGQSQARLAEAKKEYETEEANIVNARNELKEIQNRIKALETEIKNASAARESQIAAVETELTKAKKAAADADAKAKKLAQAADATNCELEQTQKEKTALLASIAAADAAITNAQAAAAAAQEQVVAVEAKYAQAKNALETAKAAVAAADSAQRALVKERNSATDNLEKQENNRRNLEKELIASKEGVTVAAKTVEDLLTKHPWIHADRQFFGQSHTDYDFKAQDPKKALVTLRELEKKQAEVERRINKKVLGMIETAEREYNDLRTKKNDIEKDKAKIEQVILELDEKKNEALQKTWTKVNKDFGSIFATLLPGVTAKLDPPENGTVLDGLEVKVAFNGVWKESLTELSGGQRSLLALSLILALLLFQPAPMYILDEVDAALDLSHTQNIGHMIRTHFGASQFIVVSLKQGMFSNANVIFRTKFVDGTSTVTRTVPGTSALLQRGQALLTDGEDETNDENVSNVASSKGTTNITSKSKKVGLANK